VIFSKTVETFPETSESSSYSRLKYTVIIQFLQLEGQPITLSKNYWHTVKLELLDASGDIGWSSIHQVFYQDKSTDNGRYLLWFIPHIIFIEQ